MYNSYPRMLFFYLSNFEYDTIDLCSTSYQNINSSPDLKT